MLVIPALDLKNQEVVRYTQGALDKKVYSRDAVAVALGWQDQGAKWLHLVDLDAAMGEEQNNLKVTKKIISSLKIPVEVGGGMRSLETVKKVLDMGASRVVIGTRAIEDIDFLQESLKLYGSKIALGLDVCAGKIGVRGWKETSSQGLPEVLAQLKGLTLKTIIYTDIRRDGTLQGVNISDIRVFLKGIDINCIVSGGVSSLEDIMALRELADEYPRLKGVIVGKALYENKFSLKEAVGIGEKEG